MASNMFCLDNYDCIGFDLDCTLAEYNWKELMKLIYDLLTNFLINNKEYDSKLLLKPFEDGSYFLQKGLFMDLKRGNVLKIDADGNIAKATHGTSPLKENEINELYGQSETSDMIRGFIRNPLSIINTPFERMLRASLDCFDMPCVLLFARIVDYLDMKSGKVASEYNIWPDILEGLHYIYDRDHFKTEKGGFFLALKENPSKYYKKWNPEKINWLSTVKKEKIVFLVTGSFIDFATLTATSCIGENWRNYFDVIICYARKPFFFTSNHSFHNIECSKEAEEITRDQLKGKGIYSQGNWTDLHCFLSKEANIENPKCLYIGDNVLQDIYAPSAFRCCDTVAVSHELTEARESNAFWGSYFGNGRGSTSAWFQCIKRHARICVSDLGVFIHHSLTHTYSSLDEFSALNFQGCYIKKDE